MAALGTHPDQIPISLVNQEKLKVKVKTIQIKKVKVKTHPDQIHISLVNQEKTKSESENTSNQKVKVKTHPDQIPISLVNQEITKSKSENKSNEKSESENTARPNIHQSCQSRTTLMKKVKTNQINVLLSDCNTTQTTIIDLRACYLVFVFVIVRRP